MKLRAILAEFIGVFAIVFIAMVTWGSGADIGRLGLFLTLGLTYAAMVSATLPISGGHLNPAVTFGMWMSRKITLPRTIGYWIAQLLGGWIGAVVGFRCIPTEWLTHVGIINATYAMPQVNRALLPAQGGLPWTAVWIEAILTFFLMFVYLGTLVDLRAHKVGGLFVGLTYVVGGLACGTLTGAAMNPARWFGPAILVSRQPAGDMAWANWPVYVVGPLIGATVASILYGRIPDPPA